MEKLKSLWNEASGRYSALSSREQRLLLLAGGAASLFLMFAIFFSLSQSASSGKKRIAEKMDKLHSAQALANSFGESERVRQDMERQLSANAVQLISYLEEKGASAGLDIPTMNPKGDVPLGDGKIIESSVELTFTDVPIKKFHSFLTSVEQGPGVVKVKYVRLEPRPPNETLTAWTTIATYRLKQ